MFKFSFPVKNPIVLFSNIFQVGCRDKNDVGWKTISGYRIFKRIGQFINDKV